MSLVTRVNEEPLQQSDTRDVLGYHAVGPLAEGTDPWSS